MRYVLLLAPFIAIAAAYQYVSHEIASDRPRISLPQATVAFPQFDPDRTLGTGYQIDEQEIHRLNARNIVNQNRLFNQRMEDMRSYARNPAGWHGAPPF